MEKVFNRYKALFQKRYSKVSALNLGEDSIRYDFFLALQEQKHLEPWQIQLEYPLHSDSFVGTVNAKRKRNEKPQVDLMVDETEFKLSAEFGFFRRNSNPDATIAATENTYKMLNDFVRLALHSHLTGCKAYFVCVADSKMLEHQLSNKTLGAFPSEQYKFTHELISRIMTGTASSIKIKQGDITFNAPPMKKINKSSKKIDDRFLQKLQQLNLTIVANRVYYEDITTEVNPLTTYIIIWQITTNLLN